MKHARTGDTVATHESPVLLERISAYEPVISLALEPRNSEEAEKLEEALGHFLQEDPTLVFRTDEETGQMILSGMGELHLEVVLERLRREYKVDPRAGRPQVVYQETVRGKGGGHAEFDRLLGETPHHGDVSVTVEPRERGKGADVFFDMALEGWPQALVDGVRGGLEDGLLSGPQTGYPLTDLRVRVRGMRRDEHGKSSEVGFRMAASQALRRALEEAGTRRLEPIMKVEVVAPEEYVGDVAGLFGAKGAKIENMFDSGGRKVVQAYCPLSALFGFSTELRSATQGRAGLMMQFARFDVLD
jgi:elongation factor G